MSLQSPAIALRALPAPFPRLPGALQIKAVLDQMKERFGGINAVVQCAGIATATRVLGKRGPHSLADFEKVLRVNTVGTFNVLRLSSERMAAQEADEGGQRGVIINTAR